MSGLPRLVFVHGAGGTSHAWDLQRLAFPGAVAPNLPGHADGGCGFTRVEAYGEWLRDAARAQSWPPMLLAGHSMGGAIALWYALSHPRDLAGIVLIATGGRLRVHPETLVALRSDYPAAVDRILSLSLAEHPKPRLAARLREAMLSVPQDVTLGDFEACDAFDVLGRLADVRVPALVIVGREDRVTPPKYAEYLHEHIPGARLVVIDGAGHGVHLERPREVNHAIGEFRERLGAAPANARH